MPGGSGFNRSVCVQELKFNDDGTIEQMNMTSGIKDALKEMSPYRKTEAETIAWSEGFKAKSNEVVGNFVTAMKDGAYIQVKAVDFGDISPSSITARIGSVHNNNVSMEVRADAKDGKLLATLNVPITGGDDRWKLVKAEVEEITGVHDLYFIVKGKATTQLMYFDYWMFKR